MALIRNPWIDDGCPDDRRTSRWRLEKRVDFVVVLTQSCMRWRKKCRPIVVVTQPCWIRQEIEFERSSTIQCILFFRDVFKMFISASFSHRNLHVLGMSEREDVSQVHWMILDRIQYVRPCLLSWLYNECTFHTNGTGSKICSEKSNVLT